jgi:hypothetical protein
MRRQICDTASVAFHESFWVATSAVAPVIALAAVVALPDMTLVGRATILRDRIQERQPSQEDSWLHSFLLGRARDTRKWALNAALTTLANLIIQASLLVVSLCALAFRQDIMPFWLAILLASGGILLLVLSTIVSVEQRWTLERGLFREGGTADSYVAADDSAIAGPEKGVHSQGSEI